MFLGKKRVIGFKAHTLLIALVGVVLFPVTTSAQTPASGSEKLNTLLRDAETAAGLFATGKLLYGADANKADWRDYCQNSSRLADRGEFRLAVREASKALFLGQNSRNAIALTFATRDLAYAYSLAGELDRAEEFANQSLNHLAMSQARLGARGGEIRVEMRKILGDIALRRNDIDGALKQYQPALFEAPGAQRIPIKLSIANAEMRRGGFDSARRILAEIETAPPNLTAYVARANGQLALAERNYARAAEQFSQALSAASAKDAYHVMWMRHGLGRALVGAGDLDNGMATMLEAAASARQLRTTFRSAEFRTGFFSDVQAIYDDAIGLLVDAKRFDEALALSEESRARVLLDQLKGQSEPGKLDTAQAISRVPAQTAVAVYHLLDNRTIAWTVRNGSTRAVIVPTGRKELSVMTERYRRSVITRASDTGEQGRRLYDLLIGPLELAAGETLVVVPHKALHYLPMHALSGPQGFVIEERGVATVPSLNAMLAIADTATPLKPNLFALGNPDLGQPALALPGAEQEVKTIGSLFAEAQVFVRQEATKPRFVTQAPGSGLIHVAAHATVDELDPLYSSIMLARAGEVRGNWRLTRS